MEKRPPLRNCYWSETFLGLRNARSKQFQPKLLRNPGTREVATRRTMLKLKPRRPPANEAWTNRIRPRAARAEVEMGPSQSDQYDVPRSAIGPESPRPDNRPRPPLLARSNQGI
jgi:hypothetical protein